MNTKLPSFPVHLHPNFTVAYAPVQQSSAPEDGEFTFSKLKNEFRALRAQKLTGLIQDTHEALIVKAVKTLKKKDLVNCINHV